MLIQPVVEDIVQEQILLRVFKKYRPDLTLYSALGKKGSSYIRDKIRGFNEASKHVPFVVMTDLDRRPCPPALIEDWIDFSLSSSMMFRIAVVEAEAWLLADRKGISKYLSIPAEKIPHNSEAIENPKEFIVSLARKSRNKTLRMDMVPEGISAVGPGYNLKMVDFTLRYWNIDEALSNSRSLKKAVTRIKEFLRMT
ncbi:MAG: hypothetical protein C4538_13040 [Nitrospiraceae bacterium]|nr:MAG: hypothetical protein C4538_13040 [Nitrospiraceae bacterium]